MKWVMISFTVNLTSPPTSDVLIPVTSSDASQGTVSPNLLTFTSQNWMTPQTVTVTAVDDSDEDGNIQFMINLGSDTGADADYSGTAPQDVIAFNIDDDIRGVVFSRLHLSQSRHILAGEWWT